ncbi:MAG: pyruvate dehydrogenase (acetyl-transferring), homodimeric type, partial [Gammaproteobacteria bacterium]|nr:pyruvate dehydrogenase (acetyl-transferring), homodimeric type [Gammaproteobacteria bacterium]
SHILASTIPNCVTYDPCFAYEMAVIVQHGMKRMVQDQENVFFYITAMNENYHQPAMPSGVENDIVKGMYKLQNASKNAKLRVQLLGSGTILREVIAAAELLKNDWNVHAGIWSVTSFNELGKDARATERWNLLNADKTPRESFVTRQLKDCDCPVIAATDYIKSYAEQIRQQVPDSYTVLGTDGFGRSDTRENLRHFFEVDRYFITVAALKSLADKGSIETDMVVEAISKYGIDSDKPDPLTV